MHCNACLHFAQVTQKCYRQRQVTLLLLAFLKKRRSLQLRKCRNPSATKTLNPVSRQLRLSGDSHRCADCIERPNLQDAPRAQTTRHQSRCARRPYPARHTSPPKDGLRKAFTAALVKAGAQKLADSGLFPCRPAPALFSDKAAVPPSRG